MHNNYNTACRPNIGCDINDHLLYSLSLSITFHYLSSFTFSSAYPTSDLRNVNPMIERTKYAITGGTAVLDCVITPGALLHHYYVIWRNGSRNLFEQPLPSVRNSTIPNSVDPRYRLDPMNLSLIINNVQMSDSFNSYYCDLHVQDPRGMTTYKYDIALNISLIVLCKSSQ